MTIKNRLKKIIIAITLIFAFITVPVSSFAQDSVVAIVNNDVITQKDLNDFLNFMRMQISAESKEKDLEEKVESMKLNLLQKLIEDRLILQEAKNLKMEIGRDRIKARIEDIKKKMGSDMEFQRSLKQQGLAQVDLESKIKDQFLMYNVIDYKIRSNIIVTPSEVTDFYEKNRNQFNSHEQRDFASIAIEDEKMANQVYSQLNAWQSFEQVAKKYSLEINKFSVNAEEGLRKDIADVIFKLNAGETSKPVKIGNLFYIFKVYIITPPHALSLSEAQETIHNFLFEKKMQERLGKWLNELKKSSYIKIL